jgi:hypothetical protein
MQKSVMVSRNGEFEGDAASVPSGRVPMVHQFDFVCRNPRRSVSPCAMPKCWY